jgi:NtrC-family two-component system response regulator AlgB
VHSVVRIEDAMREVARRAFDLILLELRPGTESGLDAIEPLVAISPWARVIVISAFPSIETAVEAMRRGASDYLPKPITPLKIREVVRRVIELRSAAYPALSSLDMDSSVNPANDFDTTSAEMREALELSHRAAGGNATILIRGESGAGRRTLARAIHAWSPRASRPFTIAGCRAPTPAMLEADWFGGTRNTSDGPVEHPGRVAHGDGGTFLIEEIDLLPLVTQSRLLRVIQSHEYERPGNFSPQTADVRIIATTSADLDMLAAKGAFDVNLLHTLQTVTIELPALRRRRDDIPMLAIRYLAFFARQMRRPVASFSPAAIDALKHHSWPGNVRELRNLVERAVVVCRGSQIETADFPFGRLNRLNAVSIGDPLPLERIEELHIRNVLASAPSLDAAATTLGIDSVTLWRRRKKYGI